MTKSLPQLLSLLTLLLCASVSAGVSAQLRADIQHNAPAGQATMKVYDGEKLLFQATTQGLNAVTESKFSPDGKWLVNVTELGYAQLWSVPKGERVKTFLASTVSRLVKADFTPDSQRLLLNFWGEPLTVEQQKDWTQYRSSLWALEPLQRIGKLSGQNWWDSCYTGNVHFDAAGERMITASFRRYEGQAAAVWNAKTGAHLVTFPRLLYPAEARARGAGGRGSTDARLSPDGLRALVLYVGNWLAEYNVSTGKLLKVRGKVADAAAGAALEQFAQSGK